MVLVTRLIDYCSQEVIRSSSIEIDWKLVLLRSWIELQESVFHEFVHFHDGCFVTASVAVVWCGEDRDDVSVM